MTVLYKRIGSSSVELYCSAGDIFRIDERSEVSSFSLVFIARVAKSQWRIPDSPYKIRSIELGLVVVVGVLSLI